MKMFEDNPMFLMVLAFFATSMAVGPYKGIILALLVGVVSYSISGPAERSFKVVYINPTSQDAVAEKVVDGCIIKEMDANTTKLQAHLAEKELEPTPCVFFEIKGKEWILYTRSTANNGSSDQQRSEKTTDATQTSTRRKRGMFNAFASNLLA